MSALQEVYTVHGGPSTNSRFLCGTIPRYWFTVAFIHIIGRFYIQLMGYFFMTTFMFGLAIPYHHWTTPGNQIGFVVMYACTFFFANFGLNSTTFVVPAEIFPARLRSTCHEISSAAGKSGAIVGAFGFLYLSQPTDPTKTDAGYSAGIGVRDYSLMILGAICGVGFVSIFLVPEANGKSLEEMSGENREESEEIRVAVVYNRTVPV